MVQPFIKENNGSKTIINHWLIYCVKHQSRLQKPYLGRYIYSQVIQRHFANKKGPMGRKENSIQEIEQLTIVTGSALRLMAVNIWTNKYLKA